MNEREQATVGCRWIESQLRSAADGYPQTDHPDRALLLSGADAIADLLSALSAAEARAVRAEDERDHLRRIANSAFVFLGEYEELHPDRELNGQEALREELAALADAGQEGKPE